MGPGHPSQCDADETCRRHTFSVYLKQAASSMHFLWILMALHTSPPSLFSRLSFVISWHRCGLVCYQGSLQNRRKWLSSSATRSTRQGYTRDFHEADCLLELNSTISTSFVMGDQHSLVKLVNSMLMLVGLRGFQIYVSTKS